MNVAVNVMKTTTTTARTSVRAHYRRRLRKVQRRAHCDYADEHEHERNARPEKIRSHVDIEYDRWSAVMVRATRRAGEAHPDGAIERLGT